MGTSTNQASPSNPSWQIVKAVVGSSAVSPERQAIEIWRAAGGEQGEKLANELGGPLFAAACGLADKATSPVEAMREFQKTMLANRASSLYLELGTRALVRAVADKAGSKGFAGELFAEVTSYYAARDLPSYVASPQRVQTTTASIDLKEQMRSHARQIALNTGVVSSSPGAWQAYVAGVLAALQGRASR